MGGSLEVSGEQGKGSTFVATIKAFVTQDTPEISAPAEGSTAVDTIMEHKVAVVAEDNVIYQEVLKVMLGNYPITVHFAENGRDAVTLVENFKPDIIFMNVHMPVLDGVGATQRIRELGFETPIVMQTANVMTEDVEHYLGSGANDVLAKPIVNHELHTKLSRWLEYGSS